MLHIKGITEHSRCTYMCRLLVGCLLFCVDVTDGAQQCSSVLQVTSGDIHGIIHRHSLLLRGVRVLVLFVLFVFTKSGVVLYTYYFIHIFTETKKILF